MTSSSSHPRVRSEAYQKYLNDCDRFSNILVGLCAGKTGLLRIQRQETLKYFQSLFDPNESNVGVQDNEAAQLLNKSKIGATSRQPLARENSNISSGATSYHTAKQHQNPNDESAVGQTYHTQPRITTDVLGRNTLFSIPSYSDLHAETGSQPTAPISVSGSRPKGHFLDLEGACVQAVEFDGLQAEKKLKDGKAKADTKTIRSAGIIVQPSRLAAYLAQDHEVERWDINKWINDNIKAQESTRSAVRKAVRQSKEFEMTKKSNPLNDNIKAQESARNAVPKVVRKYTEYETTKRSNPLDDNIKAQESAHNSVPKVVRLCKEYEMTKKFNPLNVHQQFDPEQARWNKNMAIGLAQARRNRKTLAARQRELALKEEARQFRAQMAEEANMAAEAHEAEAHEAEALKEEARQLRDQMAREASMAAEAYEAEQACMEAEEHGAGEACIAQVHRVNVTQDPELSQMAEEVSDMYLATDASAPQAMDCLNRGKLGPRNHINTRRELISDMRKSMKLIAVQEAAHVA